MAPASLGPLALLALVGMAGAISSGFYADNGVDQTVFYPKFSKRERREMQQEILSLLGLDHRPKPPSHETDTSAPRYMLDLYKYLVDHESEAKAHNGSDAASAVVNEVQLWHGDGQLHAIYDADIIMSFVNHASEKKHLRHSKDRQFWFDVSEVSVGEVLLGAELRIYKEAGNPNHHVGTKSTDVYSVTVFEIIRVADTADLEFHFLDTVNTTMDYEGWLYFNVSESASKWLIFPESNYGLYLKIQANGQGPELHPRALHLIGAKGREDQQPFMVAFFKTPQELHVRRTRAAKQQKQRTDVSYIDPDPVRNIHSAYDVDRIQKRSCQKRTLYVSFKELGWQDWIIAPDGYSAFYCSGECSFPLNAHMNATNHAIVQTLVHLMTPAQVPKPCCAPTKLASISVLYFDDNSNVILKRYRNMVVKSCGCH